MNVVKKTDEYTIFQKRSKHYAVKDANKRWINGDDKVKILLAENLIKAPEPKAKAEPAEEAPVEE
jgi:hypothetical protein